MLRLQQGFATGEMGFNMNLRCKNPERSLSALGLGCSLIPGARWLCRRRMLRCLGLPRFTGVSSTRDSDGREWGLRTYSVMQALSQRN
jgi:hypothetical protein